MTEQGTTTFIYRCPSCGREAASSSATEVFTCSMCISPQVPLGTHMPLVDYITIRPATQEEKNDERQ